MHKKILTALSLVPTVFFLGGGCSSTDSAQPTTEAGVADASNDVKSNKDAPVPLPQADAGNDCVPGDVSSFVPAWKPPSPFNQKKCTDAQVAELVNCLFEGLPDSATCDALQTDTANAGCSDCLFTPDTASAWGPVITANDVGTVNVGGCIANVLGNGAASSCGAKVSAARDCGFAACDTNCSGQDVTDAQYSQCLTDAADGACATFETAATCADSALADGGAAAKCDDGAGFTPSAIALGKIFCGGLIPSDGGSDGAADAPDGG